MKEKLQKCSSSTGSETSEDGVLPMLSLGQTNPSEVQIGGTLQSQPHNSQHSVRYLPLATCNEKPDFNKCTSPPPASSSSRVQPSTSSASSSSMSSESPAGFYFYLLAKIRSMSQNTANRYLHMRNILFIHV